jgi:hypothetical protein
MPCKAGELAETSETAAEAAARDAVGPAPLLHLKQRRREAAKGKSWKESMQQFLTGEKVLTDIHCRPANTGSFISTKCQGQTIYITRKSGETVTSRRALPTHPSDPTLTRSNEPDIRATLYLILSHRGGSNCCDHALSLIELSFCLPLIAREDGHGVQVRDCTEGGSGRAPRQARPTVDFQAVERGPAGAFAGESDKVWEGDSDGGLGRDSSAFSLDLALASRGRPGRLRGRASERGREPRPLRRCACCGHIRPRTCLRAQRRRLPRCACRKGRVHGL